MRSVLVLTQCFQCGSWGCISRILEELPSDIKVTIIGLGELQEKNPKFKYIVVPYPAFNKYGDLTCRGPLYSFLWNLPLFVLGFIYTLFTAPSWVYYNGLAVSLPLVPIAKLVGSKTVLMYHSYLGNISEKTRNILKFFSKFVDLAVVNSKGSCDDLAQVFQRDKLIVNLHYAKDYYFDNFVDNNFNHSGELVISYVGRIDEDKRCFPLLNAAKELKDDPRFRFLFAGAGKDLQLVKDLCLISKNCEYLGYLKNETDLKNLYQRSNVVWSFADVTYLGMPAVEALACGRPLIVPEQAAITGRTDLIDNALVPDKTGWILKDMSTSSVIALLNTIYATAEFGIMAKHCIEYAKRSYSSKNLGATVDRISALVKE